MPFDPLSCNMDVTRGVALLCSSAGLLTAMAGCLVVTIVCIGVSGLLKLETNCTLCLLDEDAQKAPLYDRIELVK